MSLLAPLDAGRDRAESAYREFMRKQKAPRDRRKTGCRLVLVCGASLVAACSQNAAATPVTADAADATHPSDARLTSDAAHSRDATQPNDAKRLEDATRPESGPGTPPTVDGGTSDADTGPAPTPEGGAPDAVTLAPPTGSVTAVENLGAIPASRAALGLGWNLSLGSEVEFKAAHEAGATRGRVQCSWAEVEAQSAPPGNTSLGYALPASCQQALTWAKTYDLELTLVAAFGPPYHPMLTLTLDAAAAAGSTSLAVTIASGMGGDALSSLAFPYDYVTDGAPGFLSPQHSYAGTLVSAVSTSDATHATLTLASALNTALPAGTSLTVNEVLYPSVATSSATDPSIVAYTRYVQYLGEQCAAAGVACDVELWNEPPWPDECWDNRTDCYDDDPGLHEERSGPNWGIVAALQTTTPPTGVTYTWAGPNKSGDNTVLSPSLEQYTGVAYASPNPAVTTESTHPYGSNPEESAWLQPCLEQLATVDGGLGYSSYFACNTVASSTSNMAEVEARTLAARETNPAGGIRHGISETGLSTASGADELHKARHELRQYLAYLADDFDYLEFYRLYDDSVAGETGFSFIQPTSGLDFTPLAGYTALAGLLADLAVVSGAPVVSFREDATGLAAVSHYTGTYPLDIVHLVGSRPGDTLNSEFVAVFQRSFLATSCTPGGSPPCWPTLASPPVGQATLVLPTGLAVAKAVNLTTRSTVPFIVAGSNVTLDVSDDPVGILVTP